MIAKKVEDKGVEERLKDIARSLFSKHGYKGTSVQDIVDSVGVSKPMMYYYFGDKQELYDIILREAVDTLFHQFQPNTASVDVFEVLRELHGYTHSFARDHSQEFYILLEAEKQDAMGDIDGSLMGMKGLIEGIVNPLLDSAVKVGQLDKGRATMLKDEIPQWLIGSAIASLYGCLSGTRKNFERIIRGE